MRYRLTVFSLFNPEFLSGNFRYLKVESDLNFVYRFRSSKIFPEAIRT